MRQSVFLFAKGVILLMLVMGVVSCGDDDNSSLISPPAPSPASSN